jgi:CRP/FNR family transcriptional regulator, cyclic AMP receptor protein
MQQEVYLSLKSIPFFSSLSDNVLFALAEKSKTIRFPKNAIIMHQGELSHSFHIILTGKVRVYVSDEENEYFLQTQGSGSYFGELALLTDTPRSASIKTLERTTCAVISQSDFMQWINQHIEVSPVLLQTMAEKIRQLTDEIQSMALSDVYQRLVRKLKQLSRDVGGDLVVENIKSQEELANMIGAGREMVCKLIGQLTLGGYLVNEGKSYRIIKKLPKKYSP